MRLAAGKLLDVEVDAALALIGKAVVDNFFYQAQHLRDVLRHTGHNRGKSDTDIKADRYASCESTEDNLSIALGRAKWMHTETRLYGYISLYSYSRREMARRISIINCNSTRDDG